MMLGPCIGLKLNYNSRKGQSCYQPSSHMMDCILHHVNTLLVDYHRFRRACPDYHPYVLRLYYGVLFWIQTMWAMDYAGALNTEGHQTLRMFPVAFPPESLLISGPLLELFKTLCCSQPEIPTFGLVTPKLPYPPGPPRRRDFMLEDATHHIVPNVPGIFALLADLEAKIDPPDQQQAAFPAKGQHIPVSATAEAAVVFGHHEFPVPSGRSDAERWSLVSSGLQYPCEADNRLNKVFAERIKGFEFPVQTANDALDNYPEFLHIAASMNWFVNVRRVAAVGAQFFKGSGSLADCAPFGLPANQIVVNYHAPATMPTAPTRTADPASLFPFRISLKSTARSLPELTEAMAAAAQTYVEFNYPHPYYSLIGEVNRAGPFWSIRPIVSSYIDDYTYLSLYEIIRGMMKPKG